MKSSPMVRCTPTHQAIVAKRVIRQRHRGDLWIIIIA